MTARLSSIEQPLQLARLAYEAIRNSILKGHLKPGDTVNEMTVAKELGISRTPAREALLELASQGLVEILPRKGVRIKYFTEQDVHEIFEIRELIETFVMEKLARKKSALHANRLAASLAKQRKAVSAGDIEGFLEADRLFHATLIGLTENIRLSKMFENLRDMIQVMAKEALTRESRFDEVLEEHERIMEFLKAGNFGEAREAMRLHLERTKRAVMAGRKRETGSKTKTKA